jgi:hypothetical protein
MVGSPRDLQVRLRITRQPVGSIDGLRLDDFIVGFVYDLGTTLGSYLLAQGLAEPAADDAPALVPPLGETRFSILPAAPDEKAAPVASLPEPLGEAADSSGGKRK